MVYNRNPKVWGPHYWFFIHSVAETYPKMPTATTKRKYYDLIQNLPLFIPHAEISEKFAKMLDKYPVTPYLDNGESFVRWVWFIHNKINAMVGNRELSLYEGEEAFDAKYQPQEILVSEKLHLSKHVVYTGITIGLLFLVFVLYE